MKKPVQIIVVIIVLVFVGWMMFADQMSTYLGSTGLAPNNTATSTTTAAGAISNIKIDPSTLSDNWVMYKKGAQVVIEGENLSQVVIKAMPTGSGMGQEYPNGLVLGEAQAAGEGKWVFVLPEGMSTTNLWAEGTDAAGTVVKSADLGNVGYEE